MGKKSDNSTAYVLQLIVGVVIIILFSINGFENISTIDYIKIAFSLFLIVFGIVGLYRNWKKKKKSDN